MRRTLAYITLVLLLAACGGRQNCTPSGSAAPMMPDYTDITLPCNIAPLNFEVEGADALRLEIVGGQSYRFRSRGPQLRFPMKAWKAMLQAETGGTLRLTLDARYGKQWTRFASFQWTVSPD